MTTDGRRSRQLRRAPRSARVTAAIIAVIAVIGGLTACAGGKQAAAGPTWVPQPNFTLEPTPANPGAGSGAKPPPSTSSTPSPSGSASPTPPAADPTVVATGLSAPIGIAVLPDGTALVGQRTSGVIVRVQPIAGQPVATVRTIAGIDASGDGGLLDLAASPTYSQDHLVYAYVTTPTDNRVVDFTLTGPMTPVLTGIPKSSTGNAGRIAFANDGSLLIGTGNAGQPALAQDPSSLAGKVLEVNSVGQLLLPGSPVLTEGHHALAGLCVDPDTATVFEAESSAVNLLARGRDYGWPTPGPSSVAALASLPTGPNGQPSIASGCAVADGVVYVTSLDATSMYAADIIATPTSTKVDAFVASLTGRYGRLVTVVADSDGSLWLATSNRGVSPAPNGATADDERIVHIRPSGGGAGSLA